MIAFVARVQSGGQQLYERRISQIAINPPFNANLFARPGS
jgi:hypothetical protein